MINFSKFQSLLEFNPRSMEGKGGGIDFWAEISEIKVLSNGNILDYDSRVNEIEKQLEKE